MRLPRFTTRRLMVLVAVAGLILAGLEMSRRRARFLVLAESHMAEERMHRLSVEAASNEAEYETSQSSLAGEKLWRERAEYNAREASRHGQMAKQYLQAAHSPWVPAPPDPPPERPDEDGRLAL